MLRWPASLLLQRVSAKWAQSIDGAIALSNGDSKWMSCARSRAMVHRERGRVDAVLTGIGTVLQDRPRLDVRLVETPRQPHMVVVDSQRMPSRRIMASAS